MKLHMTPMDKENEIDVLLKRMYYLEHLLYELLVLSNFDRDMAKARCYQFDEHVMEHNRLESTVMAMIPDEIFNELNQIIIK